MLRSSSIVNPMFRANVCAPLPTSRWWSVVSITARATRDGVRTPSSAATPPARFFGPCMQQESSCTTPSAFGNPPYPTESSCGSSSTMFTPSIRASSTSPPCVIIRNAFSTHVWVPPFLKKNPLGEAITNGFAFRDTTAGAWPNSFPGIDATSPDRSPCAHEFTPGDRPSHHQVSLPLTERGTRPLRKWSHTSRATPASNPQFGLTRHSTGGGAQTTNVVSTKSQHGEGIRVREKALRVPTKTSRISGPP